MPKSILLGLFRRGAPKSKRPNVRPWAKLYNDFPDDGIFDVRPGARNVTAAIAEVLRALGAEASDPIDARDHGWELDVTFGDRDFWFQVTDFGEYAVLLCEERRKDLLLRNRPNGAHEELLLRLNAGLQRDPRFRDSQWFTTEYFEDGGKKGASEPFGEAT
jgi:hypothetical protein